MTNTIFFEGSWEVCNKVGGINTVIVSKLNEVKKTLKELGVDDYILFGPYFADKAYYSFKEESADAGLKSIFNSLKEQGIICYYGTWLVKGSPKVILIDYSNYTYKINEVKKMLWEWYGFDSLDSPWDFNEPMIWSWMVGVVIKELKDKYYDVKKANTRVMYQGHEWLSGTAILFLKKMLGKDFRGVFTTHATMLGRCLASNMDNFYKELDNINPEEKAREYGVFHKFQMEKKLAHVSDAFTTVSQITALEAEKLLGRKADFQLYNGLDFNLMPHFDNIVEKYKTNNQDLDDFCNYFFLPFYDIDAKNTLYYCTMGRSELKNKGNDMMIEALGQLNQELKSSNSEKTIVTFFFIPYENQGKNESLVKNKNLYEEIENKIEDTILDLKHQILNKFVRKQNLSVKNLFDSNLLETIDYEIQDFYKKEVEIPMLSSHNISSENEIIQAFLRNGLFNREEDKVKVILYPVYLTGSDGILNKTIYQAISGCDLGIFASFYEPWGYTPLETSALGVPAVTTNLSGFGNFVQELPSVREQDKVSEERGVYVVDRRNVDNSEFVRSLKQRMLWYANLSSEQRSLQKIYARQIAEKSNWREFVLNYKRTFEFLLNGFED